MNDERFLKDWLQDTSDTRSNPQAAAEKVLAVVPETRQRSRWWPLLPCRRHAPHEDTNQRLEGRTRLMLSPVKVISAAAFTFMVGGLLLVADPVGNEPARVPGAESATAVPPALFHGTMSPIGIEANLDSATSGVRDDGSSFEYGNGWEGSFWTTTDSRMTGRFDWIFNMESPPVPDPSDPLGALEGGISTALVRIANDDGSWSGATTWVSVDDPDWESLSGWLTGEGAYEGLMAYVTLNSDSWDLMGYITPYGPPPAPEGFPSDSPS